MDKKGQQLKEKIIESIQDQGFSINPHITPNGQTKNDYRKIHEKRKIEKLIKHKNFLLRNTKLIEKYPSNGKDIDPSKIDLEIKEVLPNSLESKLFLWWNLIWWSLPYELPIGRQMRFLLWDKTHELPFGLIGLQSPPLCMSIRDKYLEIPKNEIDYWINMSLYGQRVGALPPYNQLLGGKMVSLALTANEIRERYQDKYQNKTTLMSSRKLPADLLFIITTSAFGKSSMYDRLKFKNESVSNFLGYTSGMGTFHIPEGVYKEIITYLQEKGYDIKRGYGTGPSRKLKIIEMAFKKLGISNFKYHNIKRGIYLFPNVQNLKSIIKKKSEPIWYDRTFFELADFWKRRYLLPRSKRMDDWKNFNFIDYFEKQVDYIKNLTENSNVR